jgi:hypothetical protein
MGRKKNTEFWQSAVMNNTTYRYYYNRLTELAISMFEWKNLPSTVDERFLELALFSQGKAVFFKDEVIGELALRVSAGGKLDHYDTPKQRRAYSNNGYNMNLDETNSVLIYNNYLRTNSLADIEMFAQRLYNLDRAIDVNANAQKTPVLIQCDEQERLMMKNLYMQYDGNMPFIFGSKNLNAKGLTVLKTDAPYVCDKLYTLKTQIWNEALTYLGISNTNVTKKERMISDEVIRNQGGTIASRYSRLEARRKAVEQINEMFGLEIEVNYREDYREADDEVMFAGASGDGGASDMVVDLRTN